MSNNNNTVNNTVNSNNSNNNVSNAALAGLFTPPVGFTSDGQVRTWPDLVLSSVNESPGEFSPGEVMEFLLTEKFHENQHLFTCPPDLAGTWKALFFQNFHFRASQKEAFFKALKEGLLFFARDLTLEFPLKKREFQKVREKLPEADLTFPEVWGEPPSFEEDFDPEEWVEV